METNHLQTKHVAAKVGLDHCWPNIPPNLMFLRAQNRSLEQNK